MLFKFEIYIILCRYLSRSFIKGSKNKNNFVKLTFRIAIYSHQVMGMSLKKCGLCKIYHAEYGPFLALTENKRKWVGHGLKCIEAFKNT